MRSLSTLALLRAASLPSGRTCRCGSRTCSAWGSSRLSIGSDCSRLTRRVASPGRGTSAVRSGLRREKSVVERACRRGRQVRLATTLTRDADRSKLLVHFPVVETEPEEGVRLDEPCPSTRTEISGDAQSKADEGQGDAACAECARPDETTSVDNDGDHEAEHPEQNYRDDDRDP